MCGAYIGEHAKPGSLCEACRRALPRTEQASLPENSTETELTGGKVAVKKAMHLERAAAFLFFEKEHPIQQAIHKMKYADQRGIPVVVIAGENEVAEHKFTVKWMKEGKQETVNAEQLVATIQI